MQKVLNGLANYLVRSWSPESGCQICDDKLDLTQKSVGPPIFFTSINPDLK